MFAILVLIGTVIVLCCIILFRGKYGDSAHNIKFLKFSFNRLDIFTSLFMLVNIVFLIVYANTLDNYVTVCEYHSPNCENDNLTFEREFCSLCSSSIKETGVLVNRLDGTKVRFDSVFNSFEDYNIVLQDILVTNLATIFMVIMLLYFIFKMFKDNNKFIKKC